MYIDTYSYITYTLKPRDIILVRKIANEFYTYSCFLKIYNYTRLQLEINQTNIAVLLKKKKT